MRRIRLGVIVPSSNTALEPLTSSLISSLKSPELSISVHYTRISVTQINLSQASNVQFEFNSFLGAARLLKEAKCDVIGWSGTSGGWLGFERDQALCKTIEKELQIPATTSTIALNEILTLLKVKKVGLVTPYMQDVNNEIITNYVGIGVEMKEPTHGGMGIKDNDEIAQVDEDIIETLLADCIVRNEVCVVTTFCTNLRAARKAAEWEEKFGIVLLDTVSTVIWGMLKAADVKPGTVQGWGKMFALTV